MFGIYVNFIRLRMNTLLLVGAKRRSRFIGAAGIIGLRFQLSSSLFELRRDKTPR